MGATVKEIADRCGCSKQTVRYNLRQMGLWEHHVTKAEEPGQSAVVDDEATALVCDAILRRRRTPDQPAPAPRPEQSEPTESDKVIQLYEARIAELKERIEALERQAEEREDRNRELHAQLAGYIAEIKALPTPQDINAAREAGASEERQRIHSVSAWSRLLGRF